MKKYFSLTALLLLLGLSIITAIKASFGDGYIMGGTGKEIIIQ